jgi:hypothetical protein
MEYPELGWEEIHKLRERLSTEDRKLVEGLLDKIETLYWELERARITSKAQIIQEERPESPFEIYARRA